MMTMHKRIDRERTKITTRECGVLDKGEGGEGDDTNIVTEREREGFKYKCKLMPIFDSNTSLK